MYTVSGRLMNTIWGEERYAHERHKEMDFACQQLRPENSLCRMEKKGLYIEKNNFFKLFEV